MIRSHYMVSILLHKLALYVEKSVQDGRLKEFEGRLFLTQIDKRGKKVLRCQSKHNESSGSQPRRRQKQKSLGSTISSSLDSFWNGTRSNAERGDRSRRIKQSSAPADSTFWKKQDNDDTGNPSLKRQWSTSSNASAPDRNTSSS